MTKDDFIFKVKVKKYRYILHLYMKEKLGVNEFMGLGDSPPKHYALSFSDFVHLKLNPTDLKITDSNDQINLFYESTYAQEMFKKIFARDILRWQLGRLIELDILLDRALFAIAQGLKVNLYELFDAKISPRNIGLTLLKD